MIEKEPFPAAWPNVKSRLCESVMGSPLAVGRNPALLYLSVYTILLPWSLSYVFRGGEVCR